MDESVIIGTGEERIENKEVLSTFRAEPMGVNAKADAIVKKLHYGSLTDASIEAYVYDGYAGHQERGEDQDLFYFSEWKLITYGIVMRGSNPNAMVRKHGSTDTARDSILQARLDITTDVEDLIAMQRLQKRMYERRSKYKHLRKSI